MSMNALPIELVRKILRCVHVYGTNDLAQLAQLNSHWNAEVETLLYSSFWPTQRMHSPSHAVAFSSSSPETFKPSAVSSQKHNKPPPPPPAVLIHLKLTLFLLALRKRLRRRPLVRSLTLPFTSPLFGSFIRLLSSVLATLTRLQHLQLRGPYPLAASVQLDILQHAPQGLTSLLLTNAALRCNPALSGALKRFPELKLLGKYPLRTHEPGWLHECKMCEETIGTLEGVYLHLDCLRSMMRTGQSDVEGVIKRRRTNIKAVQLMRTVEPDEFEECCDVLAGVGEERSQLSSLDFAARKFTAQSLDLLACRLPFLEYLDVVSVDNLEEDITACWPSALRNLPHLRFFSLQMSLCPTASASEPWLPCEPLAYSMLLSWSQACPLLSQAYLKIFIRGKKAVSVAWGDAHGDKYVTALEWSLGRSNVDAAAYRIF